MNALVFVLLAQVTSPPLAVVGAPLATDNTVQVERVTQGSIVPYDGVLSSEAMAVATAKRIVDCEATNTALERDNFVVGKTTLIVGIVAIVTASLAVGAGVAYAAKR